MDTEKKKNLLPEGNTSKSAQKTAVTFSIVSGGTTPA